MFARCRLPTGRFAQEDKVDVGPVISREEKLEVIDVRIEAPAKVGRAEDVNDSLDRPGEGHDTATRLVVCCLGRIGVPGIAILEGFMDKGRRRCASQKRAGRATKGPAEVVVRGSAEHELT